MRITLTTHNQRFCANYFDDAHDIREQTGAGGKGEVCRATDAKLNRDAAVKVLPSELLASYPERLARFQREARLLSSLNQPKQIRDISRG